MTDTSQFPWPLEHRLTQDMMYGLKPSALQSRSTRTSVAPLNGSTYTPGSQVIFEIPVVKGRNCFETRRSAILNLVFNLVQQLLQTQVVLVFM
jgi:hypothetical protein